MTDVETLDRPISISNDELDQLVEDFLPRGENESVARCLGDIAARAEFLYGDDYASVDFVTDVFFDRAMATRQPGFLVNR